MGTGRARGARIGRACDPLAEVGATLVGAMVAVVILLMLAVGGIDLASAYVGQSVGNGVLLCSEGSVASQGRRVKVSDDTARDIAAIVGRCIWENEGTDGGNGITSTVSGFTLEAYELTPTEIRNLNAGAGEGANDRIIVVRVSFQQPYKPLLATGLLGGAWDGSGNTTVGVSKTWAIHPYTTQGGTWRPTTRADGTYACTIGDKGAVTTSKTGTYGSLEKLPEEMRKSAETACKMLGSTAN